jgi:hypothetical protein
VEPEPEQLLDAIERAAIEAAEEREVELEPEDLIDQLFDRLAADAGRYYDPSSLKGMVRLPDSRGREVQMAYVDGYLLALQDVLRQIAEHRAWATPNPQNIETQSYFGGATRMHRRVRKTIESMIVEAKRKLDMLQREGDDAV